MTSKKSSQAGSIFSTSVSITSAPGENKRAANTVPKSIAPKPAVSKVAGTGIKAEKSFNRVTLPLTLPVSGKTIKARLVDVSPEDCEVIGSNRRDPSLLSLQDPELKEIYDDILENNQRDPVLIRLHPNPESTKPYQLIYGSTRRFLIGEIRNVEPERQLKAWLGDIPDADAEMLSVQENRLRRKESAYENARYVRSEVDKYVAAGRALLDAYEVVATQNKWKSDNVRKLYRLSDVPKDVVKKLNSPHRLSINDGNAILRLYDEHGDNAVSNIVTPLEDGFFESTGLLLKLIKEKIQSSVTEKASLKSQKPLQLNMSDGKSGKVTRNRTDKNKIKIDVAGVSDADIEKIVAFLQKL